jgi:hypothetical protein
VTREGQDESERIDLLLRADNLEWVIVIENKLWSPETGDQLARYFRCIEDRYSRVPYRGYFYLTPYGIGPAREEDGTNWKPISYSAVTRAVSRLLKNGLPDRVRDFLFQYLQLIERKVLKSEIIERQRRVLMRHEKTFHSLTYLMKEESIQTQCTPAELDILKSIVDLQPQVEEELFEFTKHMMAKHGYARYSGLGHWVTMEVPGLRKKLVDSGWLSAEETLPIVFVFDSRPNSFVTEIWLYKDKPLFSKMKGRLVRFSAEGPEPNRGDERLVEVLYRKTIIHAEDIIRESLAELKNKIDVYFESDLERDLEKSVQEIGRMLESVRADVYP